MLDIDDMLCMCVYVSVSVCVISHALPTCSVNWTECNEQRGSVQVSFDGEVCWSLEIPREERYASNYNIIDNSEHHLTRYASIIMLPSTLCG